MLTSRKDRYDINSIESQSRKLISLLKSDQGIVIDSKSQIL